MTTADTQDERTAGAYGCQQAPLIRAAGPATAAAFAERILAKYSVAPLFRRGPSLVLRVLRTASLAGDSSTGKEASPAQHVATSERVQPAVDPTTRSDRQSVMPSPGSLVGRLVGRLAGTLPKSSAPEAVFAQRLLLEHGPRVAALAPPAPTAMAGVTPLAVGVARAKAQDAATATAVPLADRLRRVAGTMTAVAEHPILAHQPTSDEANALVQTSPAIGHQARKSSALVQHAGRSGRPSFQGASRLPVGSSATPLASPTRFRSPSPGADPRDVGRLAFRSTPSERILPSAIASTAGAPPPMPAPVTSRAPTAAASLGRRAGSSPQPDSRPRASIFRLAPLAGGHRFVQRKPRIVVPALAEPAAMSLVAPSAVGVARIAARPRITAMAVARTDHAKIPAAATTAITAVAEHGLLAYPVTSDGSSPVVQASPLIGDPVRKSSALPEHAGRVGRPLFLKASRLPLGSSAAPLASPTRFHSPSPDADRRHARRMAFRSTTAEGILPSAVASTQGAPPPIADPVTARAPTATPSLGARAGSSPQPDSRPRAGLLRVAPLPGSHRFVQRKPRIVVPAPPAPAAMRRVAPFAIGVARTEARPPGTAMAVPRADHARIAAATMTAMAAMAATTAMTTVVKHGIFAHRLTGDGANALVQASPAIGRDIRKSSDLAENARRPTTGFEPGDDAQTILQTPAMTHLVDVMAAAQPEAGARSMASELGRRAPLAEANSLPTLVAASLGATAPTPVAAATQQDLSTNQRANMSSMSIEFLADRIFSILERRLVVERERRGIRS